MLETKNDKTMKMSTSTVVTFFLLFFTVSGLPVTTNNGEISEADRIKLEEFMPQQKDGADARCELCKFVLDEVDKILKENTTKATIGALLEQICNSLSSAYKLLCLNAIPSIEKSLEAGLPPLDTCIKARLCLNKTEDPSLVGNPLNKVPTTIKPALIHVPLQSQSGQVSIVKDQVNNVLSQTNQNVENSQILQNGQPQQSAKDQIQQNVQPLQTGSIGLQQNVQPQPVENSQIQLNVQPQPVENNQIQQNVQPQPVENSQIQLNVQPQPVENNQIQQNVQSQPVENSQVQQNVQPQPVENSQIQLNVQPQPVENSQVQQNVQPQPVENSQVQQNVQPQRTGYNQVQQNVQPQQLLNKQLQPLPTGSNLNPQNLQSQETGNSQIQQNVQPQQVQSDPFQQTALQQNGLPQEGGNSGVKLNDQPNQRQSNPVQQNVQTNLPASQDQNMLQDGVNLMPGPVIQQTGNKESSQRTQSSQLVGLMPGPVLLQPNQISTASNSLMDLMKYKFKTEKSTTKSSSTRYSTSSVHSLGTSRIYSKLHTATDVYNKMNVDDRLRTSTIVDNMVNIDAEDGFLDVNKGETEDDDWYHVDDDDEYDKQKDEQKDKDNTDNDWNFWQDDDTMFKDQVDIDKDKSIKDKVNQDTDWDPSDNGQWDFKDNPLFRKEHINNKPYLKELTVDLNKKVSTDLYGRLNMIAFYSWVLFISFIMVACFILVRQRYRFGGHYHGNGNNKTYTWKTASEEGKSLMKNVYT